MMKAIVTIKFLKFHIVIAKKIERGRKKMTYEVKGEEKETEYKDIKKRPIYIGWVGNSKWNGDYDHKGLNTIIKPAIEEMINEGYNIKLHLADSTIKLRTREEMVE